MTDLTAVATVLLVLLAVLLFASSAAKALSPAAATAWLIGLGLGGGPARIAVGITTTAEAVAAAAIVLWPASPVAQALCLTLFALFGIAGLLALLTGHAVECGCMGALHRSKLGWPQLAQFGLVAISIAVVARYPPVWNSTTAAAVLFGVLVATATALLAFAVPAWSRIRRARTSIASVSNLIERSTSRMALDVETSNR